MEEATKVAVQGEVVAEDKDKAEGAEVVVETTITRVETLVEEEVEEVEEAEGEVAAAEVAAEVAEEEAVLVEEDKVGVTTITTIVAAATDKMAVDVRSSAIITMLEAMEVIITCAAEATIRATTITITTTTSETMVVVAVAVVAVGTTTTTTIKERRVEWEMVAVVVD